MFDHVVIIREAWISCDKWLKSLFEVQRHGVLLLVFEDWFLYSQFIFVHLGHVIYMVSLNCLLIGTLVFVRHLCSQCLYGITLILKLWDICLLGLSSQSRKVFQFALWVTKIKRRLVLIHGRLLFETHFWCGHDLSGVLNLLQFRLHLIRHTAFEV